MKSFAVIRAENNIKVNVALRDLVRYGHLNFDDSPKKLDPKEADKVLEDVMHTNLRKNCNSAAVVPLGDHASSAIGRLKKIHPPAHIIIVSPRHDVFSLLVRDIDEMPEMELGTGSDEEYQDF
jgi:hypothetical protein